MPLVQPQTHFLMSWEVLLAHISNLSAVSTPTGRFYLALQIHFGSTEACGLATASLAGKHAHDHDTGENNRAHFHF